MKQIEESYLQALTISYNKLLEEQNSKQIQKDEEVAQDLHSQDAKLIDSDRLFAKNLVIDELAINIGEKIGKKLFGEDMSKSRVADTEAIVVHLKEIILPSLSDEELHQSNQYIQEILGEVITSNAPRQNLINKDRQGLAQFYYDNATEYTNDIISSVISSHSSQINILR